MRALAPLFAALVLSAAACSHDPWQDPLGEGRGGVLESVGGRVILPGLERFAARGGTLASALAELEATPDEAHLGRARRAWRDARASWNRVEAGLVEPPFSVSLIAQVDTLDVDVARIEADIAGDARLDRDAIAELGATRKGFFAIEYLLFGDGGLEPRRLAYARAAGEELARVADRFVALFSPRGENGLEDLARGSTDSLQRIANRLVVVAETAADQRLGAVLGRTSGGLPQPERAEAALSENSLADLLADLEGIQDLYEGRFEGNDVTGLSELVALTTPSLRYPLSDSIQRAIDDVRAIPDPLTVAAASDRASVERAFQSTKALSDSLAVDLTAALGTTLSFSPFDGD